MNKMGENKIMKKYKGVVFFDYDGTTVDEVSFILRQEISVIIYIWMKSFSKITANFLICHNDGMRHGNSAQKTLTSANLL